MGDLKVCFNRKIGDFGRPKSDQTIKYIQIYLVLDVAHWKVNRLEWATINTFGSIKT